MAGEFKSPATSTQSPTRINIHITKKMDKIKNFEELKTEYLSKETPAEKKKELIQLMQEYLTEHCCLSCNDFACIDKKICSATGDQVNDLGYVYDDLTPKARQLKRNKEAQEEYKKQTSRNRFTKEKPYLGE